MICQRSVWVQGIWDGSGGLLQPVHGDQIPDNRDATGFRLVSCPYVSLEQLQTICISKSFNLHHVIYCPFRYKLDTLSPLRSKQRLPDLGVPRARTLPASVIAAYMASAATPRVPPPTTGILPFFFPLSLRPPSPALSWHFPRPASRLSSKWTPKNLGKRWRSPIYRRFLIAD